MHDDIEDDPSARSRSQNSANRVLTILKATLNLAFADDANGVTTDAAWRRVKPFREVRTARDDHFDGAQGRALIDKAKVVRPAVAALCVAG